MRRRDREVTELNEIIHILDSARFCTLGWWIRESHT